MLTRRDLLLAAVAGAALPGSPAPARGASTVFGAGSSKARTPHAPGATSPFCFFSKHLPELSWDEVGRVVKASGFDGVDLTVRRGGHVVPERAAADLPRAIEAIRAHGLVVPMITTDLTDASVPHARPLLEAAARGGVRCFKTGYWHYRSNDVRAEAAAVGRAITDLAALARECGIALGFHNHAGYVGAALWDVAPAIDALDPRWAGYYFDPRHAAAEGSGGAWKTATRLALPRLQMLAVKDCRPVRVPEGWRLENCPLGEGLVDWRWLGEALRTSAFAGPISIHLEYEIPGAPGDRVARTMEAGRRDLAYAKRFLSERPGEQG